MFMIYLLKLDMIFMALLKNNIFDVDMLLPHIKRANVHIQSRSSQTGFQIWKYMY